MDKIELAEKFGISRTVYSLVYDDTEYENTQLNFELDSSLYGQPWTGKQDDIHEEFFRTWGDYASPVTGLGFSQLRSLFPHYYPTNGSSEAIREVIAQISTIKNEESYILVFEGEYEGYRAYAEAYGVRVVEICRENYNLPQIINDEGRYPHFFISQPSSIDGNVWRGFRDLVRELEELNSFRDVNIKIHLDLCYVGCTYGIEYNIDLTSPLIETIFFSLSKVYGVYYHRIGGVFSRKKLDALWGNRWFKNIRSLELGTRLMKEIVYGFLPEMTCRYQKLAAIGLSNKEEFRNASIETSDVVLLLTMEIDENSTDFQRSFARTPNSARMCITPALSVALSPENMKLSTDPLRLHDFQPLTFVR